MSYAEAFYFLVLLIVGVVILVNRRLEDSHIGRAWEAIREDEVAAQAMGVPLVRSKLLAFACGASFAGVMGVVFAAKQVFINPESFTFLESIGVLAMVILGGMGSIPGAVVGATVVTVLNLQVLKGFSLWLNELKNAGVTVFGYSLASLPTQFEPAKYERMVFGIILVLMMIFRPQGIFPARAGASWSGQRRGVTQVVSVLFEARAVTKRFGGLSPSTAWTTPSSAGSPRSSGPTAPARRRSSTCSPACTRPRRDGHLPRPLAGRSPAGSDHRARRVPHVPEHPALRQHDGRRERAGRHARPRAARHLGRARHRPRFHEVERGLWQRGHALLNRVGLAAKANEVARNLPYGDQRRLELARALASEPALLLLDEPTAGMTQGEASQLMVLLRQLVGDLDLAILLIEHNMRVVMEVSDRVHRAGPRREDRRGPAASRSRATPA